MAAPIVQADYPALEEIAARFQRRAETAHALLDSLRRASDPLRQGSWQGSAATAFFAEFEGEVLPAAGRLIEALAEASAATARVGAIMQAAEEEAAALFGGDPFAGGADADEKHKQEGEQPGPGLPEQAIKHGVQLISDILNVASGRVFEIEQLAASDPKAALDLALASGSHRQAIRLAIQIGGIDISDAAGIQFDPSLPNDGDTSPELVISIGKPAMASPAWLISTIKHEMMHVSQGREGRWYNGAQGKALNEVEAYESELAQAEASGLTPLEQTAVSNRRIHDYNTLNTANQGRADSYVYTLPAAEQQD